MEGICDRDAAVDETSRWLSLLKTTLPVTSRRDRGLKNDHGLRNAKQIKGRGTVVNPLRGRNKQIWP